jgi:hypothetical protein
MPANKAPEIPAARQIFREFIEIADLETIKIFLSTTFSVPESENLELLWNRAFEEGYTTGRRTLLSTLDKKLDEADERGYERGVEESKLRYFEMGLDDGRSSERSEWIENGHGQQCFMPIAFLESTGVQTDLPAAAHTALPIQTSFPSISPSYTTSATQTEATTSQNFEMDHPTCIAMSESRTCFKNGRKDSEIGATGVICENLPYYPDVFSQTLYSTLSDSTTSPTTTPALEMHQKMDGFIQKCEQVENLSFSPKQPRKSLLPAS